MCGPPIKRYLVILANSHDKLAKSKLGSISINLNIVQNNMFIIKESYLVIIRIYPNSHTNACGLLS